MPQVFCSTLSTLPALLNAGNKNCALCMFELELTKQRTAATTATALDFLCKYIFSGAKRTHMFYKSIARELDPMLFTSEMVDNGIFQDCLPMLRVMAVVEESAEKAYNMMKALDADGAFQMTNRTRATRGATLSGREHYFKNIIPDFVLREIKLKGHQVGDIIAVKSMAKLQEG
jgi:hypothetical protein